MVTVAHLAERVLLMRKTQFEPGTPFLAHFFLGSYHREPENSLPKFETNMECKNQLENKK